ncbi:MAG: hypothetical protein HYT39_00975 [Candidatus Sungbacteria bacterium]|nr:hypothetical protein [Candidatus Sungbacteria bacterium]
MVAMHTGPVNAAKNCDHCDGSGLDQNRLIGALTAKLPPHTVIYGNKAEWAIYFLCGGERRIAAGGALLEALLEVYRIMHSPPVSVEWS